MGHSQGECHMCTIRSDGPSVVMHGIGRKEKQLSIGFNSCVSKLCHTQVITNGMLSLSYLFYAYNEAAEVPLDVTSLLSTRGLACVLVVYCLAYCSIVHRHTPS